MRSAISHTLRKALQVCSLSFFHPAPKTCFIEFRDRGRQGERRRETNIHVRGRQIGCLLHMPQLGIEHTTQAPALTRDGTRNPSVHRTTLDTPASRAPAQMAASPSQRPSPAVRIAHHRSRESRPHRLLRPGPGDEREGVLQQPHPYCAPRWPPPALPTRHPTALLRAAATAQPAPVPAPNGRYYGPHYALRDPKAGTQTRTVAA